MAEIRTEKTEQPDVRLKADLGTGQVLTLWVVLVLVLQVTQWVTGFRPVALSDAVEAGAERVESQSIGEVGEDVIRKAIQTQRATQAFWSALALLGDFVLEPGLLVLRAAIAAVSFASVAALKGRTVDLPSGFLSAAWAQGFWVLRLAVQVGLMIVLRRTEVETSLVLALPPGTYSSLFWVGLRQVDPFILMGWWVMGAAAVRRNQVGVVGAVLICLNLWLFEAAFRTTVTLLVQAGMRLSILPDY